MHKLFLLLYKSRSFLTFLFLEIIALALVFKHNVYHNSIFFNSSNHVVGYVYDKKQGVNDYLDLTEVNQDLLSENIYLRTLLYSQKEKKNASDTIFINTDSTTFLESQAFLTKIINFQDSIVPSTIYKISQAKIIKNSVFNFKNYLTLDKGTKDGMKKGMGVITNKGVVGKVMRVSGNYSVVASLLHTDLKVSARMGSNDVMGTVTWNGASIYETKLDDIPKHEQVNIGDTVYTSSYNAVFPEGIPIATIKSSNKEVEGAFYDVELELLNNFTSLRNVYVIESKNRNELDSLQAFYN